MNAIVYCDGSGLALGGPGGVGYVAIIGEREYEGSLPLPRATNQQAEILAAAFALTSLDPCEGVMMWSDSEYVVKGWSEWLQGWIARGWRTTSGSAVKNQPHWRRLMTAAEKHGTVEFHWLRGHNGDAYNERADELAGEARLKAIEEAENMVMP